MKFEQKLIQYRKEKGLSQEQLAEKVNVARQTISKWELGETTPEMDKLITLSEIFEISLDELVKDECIDRKELKNEVSNTQKLAGIMITILKIFGIIMLVSIILSMITIFLFRVRTKSKIENVEMQTVMEKSDIIEENED